MDERLKAIFSICRVVIQLYINFEGLSGFFFDFKLLCSLCRICRIFSFKIIQILKTVLLMQKYQKRKKYPTHSTQTTERLGFGFYGQLAFKICVG